MRDEDLDPAFLVWSMHLQLDAALMPPRRKLLEFEFAGVPRNPRRFWLVNENGAVDMCLRDPGYKVDLKVTADIRVFIEAWRGIRDLTCVRRHNSSARQNLAIVSPELVGRMRGGSTAIPGVGMTCAYARIACLIAILGPVVSAAAQDGRLRVLDSREFKYPNDGPFIRDGRVIFSQYSPDRNNQDVVAIDPADGSAQTLVAAVRDARFIAADDAYLVYTAGSTGVATPLVVADRRTQRRLASVRLRDRIIWGHIVGDRLIVIQWDTGRERTSASPALIYRLPTLRAERTTTLAGGHEAQLWNDKIVLLGQQLALYDLDLNRIAVADFPVGDARHRSVCAAHSLRVHGDLAIAGTNCGQVAVYELPTLRLVRVIPGFSRSHTFDVIDNMLVVVGQDRPAPEAARVYELSTGRELARLRIQADFLAARSGYLLGMQRESFTQPVRFTRYALDLAAIRSEAARIERVNAACVQPTSAGKRIDIHRAIDECELAGVQSYLDGSRIPTEVMSALSNYADWLAQSLSRYGEAIPILDRLPSTPRHAALTRLAQRKNLYLDLLTGNGHPDPAAPIAGVRKQRLDFPSVKFAGDRAYVPRFDCGTSGDAGVALEVLDRESFAMIKRVVIAACDDNYQDNISSILVTPGYVVLGLDYRYETQRPNVVVLDVESLELVSRGSIAVRPILFGAWDGRLLRCAMAPGEPHTRFDPLTARLVPATDEEAIACLNGDVMPLGAREPEIHGEMAGVPLLTTPNYKVYREEDHGWPLTSYRFATNADGSTSIKTTRRPHPQIVAIPGKDAVVLSYRVGQDRRFSRFDITAKTETTLLDIAPDSYPAVVAWRNFLFVARKRDLLTYDLEREFVAHYEQDLISEINESHGIRALLVDGDRLLVLTMDGVNARVIDLPTYTNHFIGTDFFLSESRDDGN